MKFLLRSLLVGMTLFSLNPMAAANNDSASTRFESRDDGTVLDTATNLIWLGMPSELPHEFGMNWTTAKELVSALESGQYGLKDGSKVGNWRMPTRTELEALEKSLKPLPKADRSKLFSVHRFAQGFWTSLEAREGSCAYVNSRLAALFGSASTNPPRAQPKKASYHVWPVKEAKPSAESSN